MGTGQWILIYVVFMVVLFLPQILAGRKRKKAQETMLDSLKIGDEIVTIGGIHGKIAAVSETTVEITIDKNVKMTISKSAVSRVAK
ncbi:preprotein translocase, YajC subunit [Leptotrichia sp. oral taxon 215 str. W9775]|jgi:preprotein translocase, yajC subunit|uniref:preprotein translocase subunit YajC n=1 Tax=Leptotrichia sp. oral taxon 215 TaxID=712359 RepID=UPI0003AD8C05|nr:preprotein translocase subunit YajC [Leptotrichia sp. oral taxon 215]ERK68057.1 preprotein translocase, YajC subunit [Leptotrichia sp. oral taxon 215 str. W9775]MBF1335882.1 preprotein translocase subunit YajC [Leptotrichia sp.]